MFSFLEQYIFSFFEGVRVFFIVPVSGDYYSSQLIEILKSHHKDSLVFIIELLLAGLGGVLGSILNMFIGRLLLYIPKDNVKLKKYSWIKYISLLSGVPYIGQGIMIYLGFNKVAIKDVLLYTVGSVSLYYLIVLYYCDIGSAIMSIS